MNESGVSGEAAAVLAQLDHALDALTALDLDRGTDEQTIALWRELESRRRRFAPVDQAIIVQIEQRGLPGEHGYRSVVPMGRDLLRISAAEAKTRYDAALALGPRRGLTGEPLAPVRPLVAAAQAAGAVGESAAAVMVRTLGRLPEKVQTDRGGEYEQILLDAATILDVDALRKIGQRVLDTEDPDGKLAKEKQRSRNRDLWIRRREDGSCSFGGEATVEFTEYLLATLDALAKPAPDTDGARDERTPGQRRHDGLLEALKGAMRARQIPDAAGITTTVILTIDQHTLQTGEGSVTTGHGATVTMQTVSAWLDGGTRIVPVVLGPFQQVTATGRAIRLFTEGQRLAMIARDQGCSFPGCDVAPQWTEAHHVTEHQHGGHTVIGNGTLLCRFHHAHFARLGWQCHMINNLPHWTPPVWIDPQQRPRRNHAHNPTDALDLLPV